MVFVVYVWGRYIFIYRNYFGIVLRGYIMFIKYKKFYFFKR